MGKVVYYITASVVFNLPRVYTLHYSYFSRIMYTPSFFIEKVRYG